VKLINWIKSLTRERTANSITHSPGEADDIDLYNPFPDPIEIPISDVFDLHTIPPRDVKRIVAEYLHQAHEAGFLGVRIIHGKGVGVQREMVHSILSRTPYVKSWKDAPPDAGGLGATIVNFG
jgi:dsDNA-specific endonuclease/ATPase MutS2